MGKKIQRYAKSQDINMGWLAEQVNLNRRSLYNAFEREDLNTDLIRKFSEVLKHDFFQYLSGESSVSEPKVEYEAKQPKIIINIVDAEPGEETDEFIKMMNAFAEYYWKNKDLKKKRKTKNHE